MSSSSRPLEYLDWIRGQTCLVCNKEGVPHHTKAIGMGRNRNKPLKEHYSAIPLCVEHHTEIHTMGRRMFELKYNIDIDEHINILRDWYARKKAV